MSGSDCPLSMPKTINKIVDNIMFIQTYCFYFLLTNLCINIVLNKILD